jgi:hypothetical protein
MIPPPMRTAPRICKNFNKLYSMTVNASPDFGAVRRASMPSSQRPIGFVLNKLRNAELFGSMNT